MKLAIYVSTYIIYMDFIKELGPLAMGTRIKNLGELLMKDMAKVSGITFLEN